MVGILAFIAFSTLLPTTDDFADEWTFWCLFCGDQGLSDTLANILLFVPLGVGLGLLRWRPVRAWAFGTGLSIVIELVQFAIPGRWPSVGDMVFNGVGAAVGCVVIFFAAWWLRPPEARAPWLSIAWGFGTAVVFVATAYLLAPSFPRTLYWGQWIPRLEGLELYDGKVLEASVGDLPLPPLRLPYSDSVRTLLLAGAPLEISAIAGPAPPGLASIVSIADSANEQILLVGPDWDDLIFLHRTFANNVGLTHPSMRLGEWLLGVAPGDTLRITVQRRRELFCVTLNNRTKCQGFTVGEGWSVIHSLEFFSWLPRKPVSAIWLGVLMIPFGLWARRRHVASLIGGLAPVAALAATPALTGLLVPTPVYQWVALFVGMAVGGLVAQMFGEQ